MPINIDDCRMRKSTAVDQSSVLKVMGGVVWLAQASKLHKNYSVKMLLERVGPALNYGQFRYYETKENLPLAFCCWCYMNDKSLEDILVTGREPELNEWDAGENLYFVEMIAPFGHLRNVIRDLRDNVFPKGQRGFGVRGHLVATHAPTSVRAQSYHA